MATTQEIMDKLLNISACDACSDVQEEQGNEELDLYDSPPTSDGHYEYDEEEEEDDYEGEEDTYAGDDYEYYFGNDRHSLEAAVDRIQSYLSDIADDLSCYKYYEYVLDGIGSQLECIWNQVRDLEYTTNNHWEYAQ